MQREFELHKEFTFPSAQNAVHSELHFFTRPTDYSSVPSSVKLNPSCLYICVNMKMGQQNIVFRYGSVTSSVTLTHTTKWAPWIMWMYKCIIEWEARTNFVFSTQFHLTWKFIVSHTLHLIVMKISVWLFGYGENVEHSQFSMHTWKENVNWKKMSANEYENRLAFVSVYHS